MIPWRRIIFWSAIAGNVIAFSGCVHAHAQFDNGCESHLRLAASAASVEIAAEEMRAAIAYVEARGLTSGSTDVGTGRAEADLSMWYRGLKATEAMLVMASRGTPLEQTNALLLVNNTAQRVPPNVWLYPYVDLFWGVMTVLLGTMLGSLIHGMASMEKKKEKA